MPFGLSGLAAKLIGVAVLVASVGGIILVQHIRINTLTARNAEMHARMIELKAANDHQAEIIDVMSRDKDEFEKRAADAEKKAAETKATVITTTETIVKRITDHATPSDNQPVTPALRDALLSVRQ